MDPTSPSLLARLQQRPDSDSWQRMDDLYRPLIRRWLSRVPDLRDEIDDLVQEVLAVLVRELPGFERQREGSFRAWLRLITANRIRGHWREKKRRPTAGAEQIDHLFAELQDPHSALSRQWDDEHDRHVFQQLLRIVQPDFSESTWLAFKRMQLDGEPAARVAREIGLSENAVLLAKSRVLKRLREEATGLVDG